MISKVFRERADHIWKSIIGHPFLEELRRGTLPKESFKFFIAQDFLFLQCMIKCLGIMEAKATDEDSRKLISDMKRSSESVEIEGLKRLGERLGGIDFSRVEYAPTCYAYTRHLLYTASLGSFVESVSAITPCYWSYMEIGEALKESPDPLYDDWIKTYISKEYQDLVSKIIEALDRAARGAPEEAIAASMKAFLISSEYEYMFWDMAYRKEKWVHPLD
ncbi:MAG: thiaminase II [Candidatus Methanomethyliales bacterium]|nr:thiaminase II [Candidatus Methanomethylicales archaeon]